MNDRYQEDFDNTLLSSLLYKTPESNQCYSEHAVGTINGLAKHENIPKDLLNNVRKSLKKAISYSSRIGSNNSEIDGLIRASAIHVTLATTYLVGKEEKSYLSSQPKVIADLVMMTKLALEMKKYVGHSWGVFSLISPVQMLVISDSNKLVLVDCGFVN